MQVTQSLVHCIQGSSKHILTEVWIILTIKIPFTDPVLRHTECGAFFCSAFLHIVFLTWAVFLIRPLGTIYFPITIPEHWNALFAIFTTSLKHKHCLNMQNLHQKDSLHIQELFSLGSLSRIAIIYKSEHSTKQKWKSRIWVQKYFCDEDPLSLRPASESPSV